MDGLSFLEKLMEHFPLPVVIVSSLAPENSENAVRALAIGAIEIIAKPGSQFSAPNVEVELVKAIRTAARAKVSVRRPRAVESRIEKLPANRLETTHKVIAIGASTGGTRAIEDVLMGFPADSHGTVVVQHMPIGFTASFADRLNQCCKIEVREAVDGDAVVTGVALIAPGNKHLLLKRSGARYTVMVKDGPAVHFQRPSVDVLFESVARSAGSNAVGIILTGMGKDGARGLLSMRQAGARTIAQDEESCVVFGMAREAIEIGAAEQTLSLGRIAHSVTANEKAVY
jgi:two-component system chemotaxis response regulator CheB